MFKWLRVEAFEGILLRVALGMVVWGGFRFDNLKASLSDLSSHGEMFKNNKA